MAATKPEEIVRLLMNLSRSLTGYYDTKLAELHLTVPQAMLLRQLGDALPMNEAAGKLHCDPSNVTGIVDRLEARGLIERQHLATDRRVKNLALTASGRRMRRRVEAILSAAPGVSDLAAPDQAALLALLSRSLPRQ
ncbi:MAG TPA: MarR family transcriptional regulator [Candidatus Dormibacteraeota bacterium]|nr:MarR family transcriptional regulator [Candidatus Dormibacteraeota bacterium]